MNQNRESTIGSIRIFWAKLSQTQPVAAPQVWAVSPPHSRPWSGHGLRGNAARPLWQARGLHWLLEDGATLLNAAPSNVRAAGTALQMEGWLALMILAGYTNRSLSTTHGKSRSTRWYEVLKPCQNVHFSASFDWQECKMPGETFNLLSWTSSPHHGVKLFWPVLWM